MARKDCAVKTCLALLLCAPFFGAFAQTVETATGIPDGVTVRHVHATLGIDGIARIDAGSDVKAQADPASLPVYDACREEADTGAYFGRNTEYQDCIPIPGPAFINEHTFWYWDSVGGPTDVGDVDFIFYGNLNQNSELYEEGCFYWDRDVAFYAYTAVDIPLDKAYSYIMTVTGLAIDTQSINPSPDGFYIGHLFYNQTHGVDTATGMVLVDRNVNGVPLGAFTEFPYSSYPFNSSTGTSGNCFIKAATDDNVWFGGYPPANCAYTFRGRYAWVGELTGDYGSVGGAVSGSGARIKIRLTISEGVYTSILVPVYSVDDKCYIQLPFYDTGPHEIAIDPFNGYLRKTLSVTPDYAFLTIDTIPLISGDANFDNVVDLSDLTTVLFRFGEAGDP
jgi:hypothetical protein